MNLLHGRRLFGRWIYAGSIKTAGADTPVKYLPGMFQIIAYNSDGTKTAIFGAGANNNAVSEFNFKIIETGCGECTIKFNKLPTNAELNYKQRVDIHLFNDGQPWFSGYVITRPIVGTTETSFSFVIHGFYNLLEKVQLFETYENMEVSAIVKAIAKIVENKIGLVYNADKIINTGYTISKIVFDGVDVKKALEQLSDFGLDYVFGVDEKRSIYFKPRNTEINEQARFWVGKHLTSYVPDEDIEKVCNWARIKGASIDNTGESWLATVQDLDSQAAYGLQEEIWTLPSAYAAADAERWGNVQIQKYKDPIQSAKIKGVDLRYLNAVGGIMAKFSRGSTAYKQDGSVVNANVPRFEANGVMVEEGTTTPCGNTFSNIHTDWSAQYLGNGSFKITALKDSPSKYTHLIATIAGSLSSLANESVTLSCEFETNNPYMYVYCNGFGDILAGTHGTTGNRHWRTITHTAAWTHNLGVSCSNANLQYIKAGDYLIIKNPQVEKKAYMTSFAGLATTRAAESLTIPATALNATEGTIEFDVADTTDATQTANTYPRLFFINPSDSVSLSKLDILKVQGKIKVEYRYNGTTYISNYSSVIAKNIKTRCSFRYSVSSGKCSLWINGIMLGTEMVFYGLNVASIYVGHYAGMYQANALFSNLRISNKARSDAELANTGALSVDEFTTYFLPMNGNLGAQGQGVSVSFNVRKLSTDGECVITTLDGSAIQYPITSLKYSVSPEKGITCEMELGEQPFKIDTYFAELERNNKNNELLQQASNKQLKTGG